MSLGLVKGEFQMEIAGGWRVKGTLSRHVKTGNSGATGGTATIERWNATTRTWDPVQTGVEVTISFTHPGSGTAATFGEHFSLIGPPNFTPTPLTTGAITVG